MPRPILHPGVTVGDELILYGERDFIGVESRGDDARGINAAAEWTRRAKASAVVEHDENGVHDTPRIARGLVELWWDRDAGEYVVRPEYESYLRGTYYSDDPTIYTPTYVSDGVFDLDLGIAMPSINYGIISACRPRTILVATPTPHTKKVWVACYGEPLSTTKIRITVRSGDTDADGENTNCAFFLCG